MLVPILRRGAFIVPIVSHVRACGSASLHCVAGAESRRGFSVPLPTPLAPAPLRACRYGFPMAWNLRSIGNAVRDAWRYLDKLGGAAPGTTRGPAAKPA